MEPFDLFIRDEPDGRTPVLLVVDDEDAVREYFVEVLSTQGYRILQATDGKRALQEVGQNPVDLVITDLVMPEQEGIETIGALRKRHPEVKIVAVSGAFEGQFLAHAKLMGVHATLKKPVSPKDLLDTVASLLADPGPVVGRKPAR